MSIKLQDTLLQKVIPAMEKDGFVTSITRHKDSNKINRVEFTKNNARTSLNVYRDSTDQYCTIGYESYRLKNAKTIITKLKDDHRTEANLYKKENLRNHYRQSFISMARGFGIELDENDFSNESVCFHINDLAQNQHTKVAYFERKNIISIYPKEKITYELRIDVMDDETIHKLQKVQAILKKFADAWEIAQL